MGDRVFIDDGKIGAVVLSTSSEEYIELEITSPMEGTSKIRPEKGLNLPDSALNLPALTTEDIKNLDFVVKHATTHLRPDRVSHIKMTLWATPSTQTGDCIHL